MAGNISNSFVIDGSFILALLLPDEHTKSVDTFFEQFKKSNSTLLAPSILPYEVINSIYFAVKTKRLNDALATELIDAYIHIPIALHQVKCTDIYAIARKHNLTAYDASYVWLARSLRCPLLTLDKALLRA
jgi:predicted nucleic acid-binding protein